ncbi:TPA: hypothetical protein ACH3X2_004846 [Trebouxia sp. C0005]
MLVWVSILYMLKLSPLFLYAASHSYRQFTAQLVYATFALGWTMMQRLHPVCDSHYRAASAGQSLFGV